MPKARGAVVLWRAYGMVPGIQGSPQPHARRGSRISTTSVDVNPATVPRRPAMVKRLASPGLSATRAFPCSHAPWLSGTSGGRTPVPAADDGTPISILRGGPGGVKQSVPCRLRPPARSG